MRKRGLFILLTSALLSMSIVAVSAQNVVTPDSQELERKVFKEIKKLPYYGVFDFIAFEINDGTVTLSGSVYNAINRKHAESYVEDVDGVTEVINNIEVLPPSSFDDSIRRRTVRAFVNSGSIYRYLQGTNPSVRIIVDRGRVTLEGIVSSEGDSRLANIAARGVTGTFEVTNNLKVLNRDI